MPSFAEMKALGDKVGGMATTMGLTTAQTAGLVTSVGTNPAVFKMVMDMDTGKSGADPKFNKFLKELGDRYKADPGGVFESGFVDKLNADLKADPTLGKRLTNAVQTKPDQAALAVKNYQPGQLGTAVKALEATAAPAAAPVAAPVRPPVAAPTAAPAPAASGKPQPAVAAPPPAKVEPIAVPAARPPEASPPPVAAPSSSPPTAPVDGAAAIQGAKDQMIKALSTGSNEQIKGFMQNPDKLKAMLGAVAEYGEGQPELKDKAKGFMDKINANPNALKQIGDNLANNPDLVRKMAKAMDDKGPSNKAMDGQMKQVLAEVYEKPEATLGSKGWTDGLQSKMMAGGAMDWMKTNMGIDIQGMLGGLGNMLQGLFSKISGFFQQFSTGNFMQIGNMDPKAGLFTKMGRAMDQANAFGEREGVLREQAELLRKPGAKGEMINDGSHDKDGKLRTIETEKKGPNGETVVRKEVDYKADQDHRVTVNAIGNNANKVYLTDNLQPTREPNGNYRWTVAESVDPNTGRAGKMTQLIVSPEESQRLYKIMEQSAAETGQPLRIRNPNVSEPTQELARGQSSQAYNVQTRQFSEVGGVAPANQPGVAPNSAINAPKPGDPEFRPGMPGTASA